MTGREPTLQTAPRQVDGVWLARHEGAHVLHDADGRRLCVVNDTAAALWELCDGTTTVEEMVAAIRQYWSVDTDAATEELVRALTELESVGALEPHIPLFTSSVIDDASDLKPAIEESSGTK